MIAQLVGGVVVAIVFPHQTVLVTQETTPLTIKAAVVMMEVLLVAEEEAALRPLEAVQKPMRPLTLTRMHFIKI